jgi:hypothetical protein
LIPLGVGFAVALSAGPSAVAPPSATMSSASGAITAAQGSWCWQSHGHHHCAAVGLGAAGRAPVLTVSRGRPTVEVSFGTTEDPTSVSVTVRGPGGAVGPAVTVVGRNPGRFVASSLPDGAEVSVSADWPQGHATYLARLRLT